MADKLYVVRNGSTDTSARKIRVDNIEKAISFATFQIPNPTHTLLATWEGYKYQTIEVWANPDTGDDRLIFSGAIVDIDGNDPITVKCCDLLGQMAWYLVDEASSDFVQDEGLISNVVTTTLTCTDDEGASPGWAVDTYTPATGKPDYYAIVSDNTRSQSSLTLQNGANNYIGYDSGISAAQVSGAYTDVEKSSPDGTGWKFQVDDEGGADIEGAWISLSIGSSGVPIVKSATIDKIVIDIAYKIDIISVNEAYNYFDRAVKVCLYDTASESGFLANIVGIGECPVYNGLDHSFAYRFTVNVGTAKQEVYFHKGAVNYEGGYIALYIDEYDYAAWNTYINCTWLGCAATVYYTTGTFETLNVKITDNTANTLVSATNFADNNVANGDRFMIGIDYYNAFQNCFIAATPMAIPSNLAWSVNEQVAIGKGIAQRYFGQSGFGLFSQLAENINYTYFCHYGLKGVVKAIAESSITTEATELTGFKWNPGFNSGQDARYGFVAVVWKEGTKIVATGTGDPTFYSETHKEIITEAEAYQLAASLATKYASYHRSIQVQFAAWVDINYGHRYDLTVEGVLYEDQLCRRCSFEQDGANGPLSITAYLGGGHTPPQERTARTIGLTARQLKRDVLQSMTGSYSPVTRHNALNGLLGNADMYHVDSSFAAMEVETAWTDSDTKLCSSKGTATKIATYIEDSVTDGHSTIAPSGNAVFDALALKAPLASPTFTGTSTLAVPPIITTPSAFGAKTGTAGSYNNGSNTIIVFGTQEYDYNSEYDHTTGIFTCKIAGVYHFDACVLCESDTDWDADDYIEVGFYKNNAQFRANFHEVESSDATGLYMGIPISCDILLAVNDTIDFRLKNASGGTVALIIIDEYNYFTGHLVARIS